ncbi:signal recognition particle-docking protein FtsY, partial [Rhizobium leguminosarum]|nr:signal recognition particle-docking protein FtsY [Rhizobium leguminosarum]
PPQRQRRLSPGWEAPSTRADACAPRAVPHATLAGVTRRPDAPPPADPRTRAALRAVLTVLAVMAVLFAAVVLMLAYGPAR